MSMSRGGLAVAWIPGVLSLMMLMAAARAAATEPVRGRPSLVFSNATARLVVEVRGGALGEFRRAGHAVNPLDWGTPREGELAVRGFGHFLCLDRWGPPSEAEGARGMPYHGEASVVVWNVEREVGRRDGVWEGSMTARLPKAGLAVRRTIRMSGSEAVFAVREEVTNENALGRLYNMVQHPTVGPPFLDERTVVDCNGRRGFAQGGSLPDPEEPSAYWPRAYSRDGATVDLRRLEADPEPNVVTYAIEEELGWVTATSPTHGLVLGYVWRTADYPWVSHWRNVRDGRPAARGLEFGTTGLHQPYATLVKKGRIWERPLYEYLDAGETAAKGYLCFLLAVPAEFDGVESVALRGDRLVVRVRGAGSPREITVGVGGVWGK